MSFVKQKKVALRAGLIVICICVLMAAVIFLTADLHTNEKRNLDLLKDSVSIDASKILTCTSADGGTSEFYLLDAAALSFDAENQADFEVELTLQKRDWRGTWHDADINGESSLIVPKSGEKAVEKGETYTKGTYRFQATGSNGPSYDYAVTVRAADPA